MRNIVIIIVLTLIVAAPVYSADYLRIGIDSLIAGKTNQLIPFYVTRECPVPDPRISLVSNGFEMTATGCTWTLNSFTADPEANNWFNLSGLLFTDGLTGTSNSGSFLIGAAAMGTGGMPNVTEHLYFTLNFDISNDEGEICIDSAFYGTAGTWKWSGMDCGQVGAPDRPLFVDKYGSDDNHPICITVYDAQCVTPTILSTPPGDFFEFGYWMIDTTWQFNADPGEIMGESSHIEMWSVTDGPGEIDSTGLYSANFAWPIGDYNITIEAHNECTFSSYSFTLSSTGNECGNTNGAESVDVDDIVAVIAYIFLGGQSIPTPVGDVDCSGAIDIDDAVYLLYYIFAGSAPPCDPDDDGVKDCY